MILCTDLQIIFVGTKSVSHISDTINHLQSVITKHALKSVLFDRLNKCNLSILYRPATSESLL